MDNQAIKVTIIVSGIVLLFLPNIVAQFRGIQATNRVRGGGKRRFKMTITIHPEYETPKTISRRVDGWRRFMKAKSSAANHTMKAPLFALLVAVTIFSTVGCGKATPPGYHLSARFNFNTVRTLTVGDPVMMAGHQIGQVEAIVLDPTPPGTSVTMQINHSVVVKVDSVASIKGTAPPRRNFITLEGGSATAVVAKDGSILMSNE